jgi:4-hydroxy-tetrahydrodipicolinate synthase
VTQNAKSDPLTGVLPIITTPFDEDGRLDFASLAKVVEHVLRSGAHGLVYPAIASEFQTLSWSERKLAVEHVLAVADGRLPTVVGVSTIDDTMSPAELAAHAAKHGASAVMLMPQPPSANTTAHDLVFANVAQASALPIILQNAPPPLGSALAITTIAEIARKVSRIQYVKEETVPCGQRISNLLAERTGLIGVFGGAGGRFVLDELARGALGSMPACEFTAIHVDIYERFRAGDRAGARQLFNRLLPLLNFESVFRTAATKHILHDMGIIASRCYRDHNPELDESDRSELALILEDMSAWRRTLRESSLDLADGH